MKNKQIIYGVYSQEDVLKSGIIYIQQQSIIINDVYTPYPVHDLEKILSIPRSRIPIAGFIFGCIGAICAFTMMWYMMTYDWPMNIGGKPNFPVVSFIPITFELTVLFSAFGMGFVFFIANNLYPGSSPNIIDERATDDKFIVALDLNNNEEQLRQILNNSGAEEVKIKSF